MLCIRAQNNEDASFVYAAMRQEAFFDYVMSGAKGTKMPRGDKTHIMQYEVPILSKTQMTQFNQLASCFITQIRENKNEIALLKETEALMLCVM